MTGHTTTDLIREVSFVEAVGSEAWQADPGKAVRGPGPPAGLPPRPGTCTPWQLGPALPRCSLWSRHTHRTCELSQDPGKGVRC